MENEDSVQPDRNREAPARRRFLQAAAGVAALTGAAGATSGRAFAAADDGRHGADGRGDWVTTWSGVAHGTYPTGTAILQPSLAFAFPDGATSAVDQSFRMIVRPTAWGDTFRFRFSNVFGTQPLTLDDVHAGLQASAGTIADDTNRPVSFQGGRRRVVIPAGQLLWSDPVALDATRGPDRLLLYGRKLAVSFHVVGSSGPMSWHSKALQTNYLSAPGAGAHGGEESDEAFPYTSTSWYFLDAVDTRGLRNAVTVVALGDSITDGTGSTLNGDDRWPDVLGRRLRDAYGNQIAVANAGIGGNRILTDAGAGGPPALGRLERDVLGLSGGSAVIWFEGINDLSAGASAASLIDGIRSGVATLRARRPSIKLIQATITSNLGSASGTPELDARRQAVNAFIRSAGIFDAVADFDAATVDAATGRLRPAFQPNSSTAAIDFLHPNRAGYLAMARTIDLDLLAPPYAVRRRKNQ
ncbi:lysophospholipase [Massilia forsythiae]|uniref:Lysophospholipase n=1 Tax=Massilia forsythiae TaxID=2728020 RepID=A0A7Z2ZU29_9BURK|nr:GDSL-type esterase/lipase family protein [Massilia forsythiae]QJE01989.1 lysophospholipase [Massilia forsythiae]